MSHSDLQSDWNELYKNRLPSLARAKDPAQPRWPVALDHCFARIILDNAVGKDKPWTEVLPSPAYKNMTEKQLRDAIALGEDIARGAARLVDLDERSLRLRGKQSKEGRRAAGAATTKRKAYDQSIDDDQSAKDKKPKKKEGKVSSYFLPSPNSEPAQEPTAHAEEPLSDPATAEKKRRNPITDEEYPYGEPLDLIQTSNLTPFRKKVLAVLCQVPRGKYTTYQAMSDHISATSHKTCARAVGNAMRNNPFAPVVPCHRVLATGGRIGGFGGEWGDDGKHAKKKRDMLREEGIRFDGGGKVVGDVFRGFK